MSGDFFESVLSFFTSQRTPEQQSFVKSPAAGLSSSLHSQSSPDLPSPPQTFPRSPSEPSHYGSSSMTVPPSAMPVKLHSEEDLHRDDIELNSDDDSPSQPKATDVTKKQPFKVSRSQNIAIAGSPRTPNLFDQSCSPTPDGYYVGSLEGFERLTTLRSPVHYAISAPSKQLPRDELTSYPPSFRPGTSE